MNDYTVLIVDDEAVVRIALEQWLELSGFTVLSASNVAQGLAILDDKHPEVVLSDVRMQGPSGMDLLRTISDRRLDCAVILITAHGDVPMVVEAMRDGAFDFIQKPYVPEQLVKVLRCAGEQCRLKREVEQLRRQLDGGEAELSMRLAGVSKQIEVLRNEVRELALVNADVIIRGETGTGKEVVARCLHDFSPRRDGPFVAVNCAAIPAELIESELFGHEAGAFTGSRGLRIGKFEHANGGTLLLDEIESMPLVAQAKVLRVIQERMVERLGSNTSVKLDVRIVAASKSDLAAESEAGRFRSDLYYRLNVTALELPSLRERPGDVPFLFQHFLEQACRRSKKDVPTLHPADYDALVSHDWPGNVRELKATAERFALGLATVRSVEGLLGAKLAGGGSQPSLADRLANYERHIIETELARHNNSVAEVLKVFQIPRRTLNEKMTRLGIRRVKAED